MGAEAFHPDLRGMARWLPRAPVSRRTLGLVRRLGGLGALRAAKDDETNHRMWNNKANRFGWQSYTGHAPGSADVSGLAAAARHDDLSGLPPAWIGVGTLDLFYEEDPAYAKRLEAAGVKHELLVVDGAFHGFDLVRPKAGVSQSFRAAQVKALATALL